MRRYSLISSLVIFILLIGCSTTKQTTINTIEPTMEITETIQPTVTITPSPTATPTQIPTVFGGYKVDRLIAYVYSENCMSENGDENLCISSLNGMNEVNLSSNLISPSINAKNGIDIKGWSPDGSRILFVSRSSADWNDTGPDVGKEMESLWCVGRSSPSESCGLWVINPDGTDPKLLIPMNSFYTSPSRFNLNWNPDSSEFLTNIINLENGDQFDNYEIGLFNINDYSMSPTGNFGRDPKFSPDGKEYAFVKVSYPKNELFIVKDNNSVPVLLTAYMHGNNFALVGDFVWSLDSQKIIYAAGSKISQITINEKSEELLLDLLDKTISFGYAQMSPDGNYLKFDYSTNGGRSNFPAILNIEKKSVLFPPSGIFFWTADSQLFYTDFKTDTNNDYLIYLMNLDNGEITLDKSINFMWLVSSIQP